MRRHLVKWMCKQADVPIDLASLHLPSRVLPWCCCQPCLLLLRLMQAVQYFVSKLHARHGV